ncbi:hypothetical protein [Bacillus subtilis]|uniref:hypothetical protein n=1 Tax=Bacillus subtilis TaxID=1423 RepID=UPI003F853154
MIGYCGEENFDWVASLISFLAVVVAIASIWIQIRQFKKQREPVIAPGIKSLDLELPRITYDWVDDKRLDGKFADTTLPIFNYGSTSAINIIYSYKLNNHEKVRIRLEELLNDQSDLSVRFTDNYLDKDKGITDDLLFVIDEVVGNSYSSYFRTTPYIRRIDLILPGESVGIKLPSYFLILINYLSRMGGDDSFPELELKIIYNDTNFKSWETKFIIKVDQIWNISRKANPTISFRLQTSLVNEFISKNKK